MKFSIGTAALLLLSSVVDSAVIPERQSTDLVDPAITPVPELSVWQALEKRRGGGGRGGGSVGSGGGGGGRSGSGGRGGSSGRGGSTSSSSNRGGTSRGGSGRAPAYGGGSYYAGGSRTPYSAGSRTPGGLVPFILPAAGLGLAYGAYSAYGYPYHHRYNYTDSDSHKDESLPVVCVCEQYMECGCDDNNNSTFYHDLFNGTQPKNGTNVRVLDVNGTQKIYVNGTLPNGTTAAENAAPATVQMAQSSGYLAMVAIALSTVYAL